MDGADVKAGSGEQGQTGIEQAGACGWRLFPMLLPHVDGDVTSGCSNHATHEQQGAPLPPN